MFVCPPDFDYSHFDPPTKFIRSFNIPLIPPRIDLGEIDPRRVTLRMSPMVASHRKPDKLDVEAASSEKITTRTRAVSAVTNSRRNSFKESEKDHVKDKNRTLTRNYSFKKVSGKINIRAKITSQLGRQQLT